MGGHNTAALLRCYVHGVGRNGIWTSNSHHRLGPLSVLFLFLFSSSLSLVTTRQDNHDQLGFLTWPTAISCLPALEASHPTIYTRYHHPPTNISYSCRIYKICSELFSIYKTWPRDRRRAQRYFSDSNSLPTNFVHRSSTRVWSSWGSSV